MWRSRFDRLLSFLRWAFCLGRQGPVENKEPDEERGEANEETILPEPGPESDEEGDGIGPMPQGNADPDIAAAQEIYLKMDV